MKLSEMTKVFFVITVIFFGTFSITKTSYATSSNQGKTLQNDTQIVLEKISNTAQKISLVTKDIIVEYIATYKNAVVILNKVGNYIGEMHVATIYRALKVTENAGDKYISGIYNTASVSSAVGDIYMRAIYGIANLFNRSGDVYINGILFVADKITDIANDDFYAKQFAGYVEPQQTVTKQINSSDEDKIEKRTVIVNGVTEDYLERRLVSFRKSLNIPDAIQIRTRDTNGSNISVDRIYDSISDSSNDAAEDAVTGGSLSFSGINGNFTGDVTVAGELTANSLSASALTISATSTFNGATNIAGPLLANNDAGTNGYVLQTTGTGVQWVATSSLGIMSGGTWGSITGTLADQTDLQSALDAKQNSFATGTASEYLKGDLTLGTFPTTTSAFFNDSGFATGTPWTTEGYLTSFTELDPVFTASDVAGVVTADISNWNTAFGWGDHAGAGYITGLNWNQIGGTQSNINLSGFTNDSGFVSNLSSFTTDDLAQGSTNKYSQWTTSGSDIYYNSGNVGIGTSTPSRKLHVSGGGVQVDNSFGIWFTGTTGISDSAIYKWSDQSLYYDSVSGGHTFRTTGSYTPRLVILNAGNVGIGTTAPAQILHTLKDTVDGITYNRFDNSDFPTSGETSQGVGLNFYLQSNLNGNAKGVTGSIMREAARIVVGKDDSWFNAAYDGSTVDSHLKFYTTVNDSVTERMRITSAGNVGIGTTAPDSQLQLGTATLNSNLKYRSLIVQGGYSSTNQRQQNLITFGTTGSISSDPFTDTGSETLKNWHIGVLTDTSYYNSNRFSLISNGTERLTILNAGNVGIGTTAPVSKFHIASTAPEIRFSYDSSNNYRAMIKPQWPSGPATRMSFGINSTPTGEPTEQFVIMESGKVGIGTITPSANLSVYAASNATFSVESGGGGGNTATFNFGPWSTRPGGAPNKFVSIDDSAYSAHYTIWTAPPGSSGNNVAVERFRITSSGLVGIGTTAPTVPLQVVGNIYSSGASAGFIFGDRTSSQQWQWYGSGSTAILWNGSSNLLGVTTGGLMGIGTITPSNGARLDIADGNMSLVLGADSSATTRTNNTTKISRVAGYHYTNAEEPVGIFIHNSSATDNAVSFGGGSSLMNSATSLNFYTAANTTTTTGTSRMFINSSGLVGIGITTPTSLLHLKGNASSANNLLTLTGYSNDYTLMTVNTSNGHPYLQMNDNTNTAKVYLNTSGASYFNGGNVGIGSSSPSGRLLVETSVGEASVPIIGVRSLSATTGTWTASQLFAKTSGTAGATFGPLLSFVVSDSASSYNGGFIGSTQEGTTRGTNSLSLGTSIAGTNNTRMTITSAGNVGIGTTTPQYLLHVYTATGGATTGRFEAGSAYCDVVPASSGWSCSSDERLKENIVSLNQTDSLTGILALNPVSFEWKTDESNAQRIGLIAQEVEKIFPDLVNTDRQTGFKSVSYGSFTTYIIGAIQELNVKIETVFASFVDQVVEVRELIAGKLKINGDVCVDDVCVTKEQFKEMLRKGGGTATVIEIVDDGTGGTGTTTDDGTGRTGTSTDDGTGGSDTPTPDPVVEPTSEPIVPPAEIVPPPESVSAPVDEPAPVEITPEPVASEPAPADPVPSEPAPESAPAESGGEAVI